MSQPQQLSDAEVDACLFALGIGSDARGTQVLLCGWGPLYQPLVTRLAAFGADVDSPENAEEFSEHATYDFVIYLHGEVSPELVDRWLKPGGRYMILLDGVGDQSAGVTITDVQALGVSAVRVLGYKARRDAAGEGADQ